MSGCLGDAAAGLEILKQRPGKTPSLPGTGASAEEALLRRFCYPQPRINLGRRLSGIATACMDLSDGLMTDLPRLLRCSQLRAHIEAEKLPISGALREFAATEETYRMALAGGDDYELCFTVPPKAEHRLEALSGEPQLTRIGNLLQGEGLILTRDGAVWEPPEAGFHHFS